jgi:hypothetical protein
MGDYAEEDGYRRKTAARGSQDAGLFGDRDTEAEFERGRLGRFYRKRVKRCAADGWSLERMSRGGNKPEGVRVWVVLVKETFFFFGTSRPGELFPLSRLKRHWEPLPKMGP